MNQKNQLKNNLIDIKNKINSIKSVSRDKKMQSEMISYQLNQNNIKSQQITKSSFVKNNSISNNNYIIVKPLNGYK